MKNATVWAIAIALLVGGCATRDQAIRTQRAGGALFGIGSALIIGAASQLCSGPNCNPETGVQVAYAGAPIMSAGFWMLVVSSIERASFNRAAQNPPANVSDGQRNVSHSTETAFLLRRGAVAELCVFETEFCEDARLCLLPSDEAADALRGRDSDPPYTVCLPLYQCAVGMQSSCDSLLAPPSNTSPPLAPATALPPQPTSDVNVAATEFCERYSDFCMQARRCASGVSQDACDFIRSGYASGLFQGTDWTPQP